MTINAQNFLSWPVAIWLGAGVIVVTLVWLATIRTRVMWQRVFLRAASVALCYTPLPTLDMFTEAVMGGRIEVVPLWYVLWHSVIHGALPLALFALVPWLLVTYVLWVAGMSMHNAFWRKHD